MFKTNDYFIYSSRGVCRVDDVCDKQVNDVKRKYYVFHPVADKGAKIMIPVDNKKTFMRATITPQEAKQIISYFDTSEMIPWNDNKKLRDKEFDVYIRQSDAQEVAKILKVLLFRKANSVSLNKKFADTDNRLLLSLQQLLFNELAVVLGVSSEKIAGYISEAVARVAAKTAENAVV